MKEVKCIICKAKGHLNCFLNLIFEKNKHSIENNFKNNLNCFEYDKLTTRKVDMIFENQFPRYINDYDFFSISQKK